jgi:hypothetical protein
MVLANQNAKLTGPDQGFLVTPLVLTQIPENEVVGAQVSSLAVEYCSYLRMNCSRKEIFTMSLRNGPQIYDF